MKFGTKAIHSGLIDDPITGAIIPPIYQTSTYAQKAPGEHKGYEYSRTQNPTRAALEKNIAAIENAKHGLCFSSGMGAIDAIVKLLNPGDEVIANNDLYGGTYRLFVNVFTKYGIKFHFVNMDNTEGAESLINKNTRLFWVETPSNPIMNIVDIQAISNLAKKSNALMVVDNTFASPYLQNPLNRGADIVLHSATKYLGGHSDVIMGAIACLNDDLAEKCRSMLILTEGFPTYGGLAGYDLESIAVGLYEALREDYLAYRIRTVAYVGERLTKMGIPILQPPGGHAIYLDAKAWLTHIPQEQFPGWALVNVLYCEGGIRTSEIGSVMFGQQPDGSEKFADKELVRLAFPRRVYTQSHIDYVVEVLKYIHTLKDSIKGVRITKQPTTLRHFTANFETVE